MLCEIEFSHVVGTLRIADILSVDPNESCRVDAAKVDKGAACVPSLGQIESAHIGAHGVDAVVLAVVVIVRTGLDERRSVGVGIFHIAVDGFVITQHFPV